MAGLMSKRQQARNEKALQELLRSVPGNDRCADCATKNPGWASWSLGIFLCMSCAALHRKMGTHISKVKSLSMDSWSSDQVDNMKKVGNAVSNKKYNPGNTKPDIPIDADEVGGVMERFIRRKYELREFSGGNGGGSGRRVTINNTGNSSISSAEEQPPPLPPKPGKKFGFALRSTSATFSRPKMDKYTPPMSPTFSGSDGRESPPRVNKASRVFGSSVGNAQDDTIKAKLTALREMGFNDPTKNAYVLKEMNGSLSGAVEGLIRLGETAKPASRTMTPVSAASGSLGGLSVEKRRPSDMPPQAPPKDNVDPFAALDSEAQPPQRAATQPLPQSSHSQTQQATYNPFFSMASQNNAPANLQDAFAGINISSTPQPQPYANAAPQETSGNQYNPFLNNTTQQPQMHPPYQQQQQQPQPQLDPSYQQPQQQQQYVQQQQQYVQQQNPYAQMIQPQRTSNPYLRSTKSQTFAQPQSNPFFQQTAPQNPWLVSPAPLQTPPSQTPLYQAQPQPDVFGFQQSQQLQQYSQPTNGHDQTQANHVLAHGNNPFHAQSTPQQQQQPPPQQNLQNFNPYQSYQTQQPPQQPISRYDNASILQLYNYPQMAPARPLQSLQEEAAAAQPTSNAPPAAVTTPGRAVTMPVSGSMNPFFSGTNGQAVQPPAAPENHAYNHASRESMAFVGLGSGRQSPDAFANLSSRYGR